MSTAKVLVVASLYEATRVAGWLDRSDLEIARPVRIGDGTDDTLGEYASDPADVVILAASLEGGDSHALAQALRAEGPSHLKIILVGDERGPVRSALDAAEYGADRFLRRPLAEKAVLFAVKSCLPGAKPITPVNAGVVGRVAVQRGEAARVADLRELVRAPERVDTTPPELASRLDAVTSSMVDAFIVDALAEAVKPPAVELVADEADEAERELGEKQTTGNFTAPAQLAAGSSDALPAVEAPPWREPTLILSAGSAPPAVVAAVEVTVAPAEEPNGAAAAPGTLARELRRTMSAIEKRLFGDEAGDSVADITDDAEGDIDLDKIAGTSPGSFTDASTDVPPPAEVELYGPADGTSDDDEPLRHDLADEDAASLVARLYREGWSGKAVFRQGDTLKIVYFEAGRPIFATSNLPHDRMGDLLWREGKITRAQWTKSREILAETGRRMGEILVEMGFLKQRELLPAVRRHVEDIIYSLFGWDSGEVELVTSAQAAAHEKIRLASHPAALIFEGVRRKMDLGRLRDRLGGEDTVVVPEKRDEIGAVLAEADLSLEERALADLFDGKRSFADVGACGRQDLTTVYQLAYALTAMGLLRAFERGREEGRSVAPGSESAIDRERVLAKHALVSEADYFMVLGVRRDATSFEIKRAWEASRRDYAPEAFSPEVQRELGEPLREIAAVLDEAYHVLKDQAVRSQYIQNLSEPA